MHNAWMRAVAGRLESRYQYSSGVVYNNYPWPQSISDKQQAAIETAAQAVLDARLQSPNSTLADLYDPLHPAVLMLIAHTLASAEKVGIPVSVCGEMAGDPEMTRLLLGMGLRIFSLHPDQILKVKQRVLKSEVNELAPNVRKMLRLDEPGKLREALEKLNS